MEKIRIFILVLGEVGKSTESNSSIENLILKTLGRILERDLAALLFGAAVMLVVLIKYWNIPKKWEEIYDRLQRIEKRQKKFYPLLLEKIDASKYIDADDFEDEDNEDIN